MRTDTISPELQTDMRRRERGSVQLALVAVVLILVVLLLLVPAGQHAREAARRTHCK